MGRRSLWRALRGKPLYSAPAPGGGSPAPTPPPGEKLSPIKDRHKSAPSPRPRGEKPLQEQSPSPDKPESWGPGEFPEVQAPPAGGGLPTPRVPKAGLRPVRRSSG